MVLKAKTINFLEENIGTSLHNRGVSKIIKQNKMSSKP